MPSNPTKLSIPARVYYFISRHLMIAGWVLHYIVHRRAWWIAPLILMLMIAGLGIFVSANPALSPLLYALF